MTPEVSIVVTVKDAASTLPGLLESLAALDRPERLELVVVDACSTDGTWRLLQDFADTAPFPVILDQRAGGIGAGRNRGFELVNAPFVAVTDADMRVPPEWIDRLLTGMEDGIGAVSGPNDGTGTGWLSRATDAIPTHGPSLREVPVFGRSRFRHDFTTDSDHFAAVTRNCLFRRAAFEEAGGFDESLLTAEDGELNRRILDAGHKIRYVREAGVRHEHRPTLRRFYRQIRNYGFGQAQANRSRPGMRRAIHVLPSLAWMAYLLLAIAAPLSLTLSLFWVMMTGLGAMACILYGIKAAVLRRDRRILLGAALLFAVWMTGWASGYLQGRLRPRTHASHAD